MKKILNSIFALSLIVFAITGCRDEKIYTLKLNKTAYAFPDRVVGGAANSITINVEVTEGNSWSVELVDPTNDWVRIGDKTAESIVISVEDNRGSQRQAKLIFKSGIAERTFSVYQLPYESDMARYRDLYEAFMGTAISPNGKYIGGYNIDYNDAGQSVYTPIIIDVETDEWHYLPEVPETQYSINGAVAITNDGVLYLSENGGKGNVAFDLQNNVFSLRAPTGFKFAPEVSQVSADGKVVVGYAVKLSVDGPDTPPYDKGYWPVVWDENKEPRALGRPDLTLKGNQAWAGCMVRGISPDGKFMYGSAWDEEDDVIGGLITWDENGNVSEYLGGVFVGTTDKVHGYKTVEFIDDKGPYLKNVLTGGLLVRADTYNISETGKWIACIFVSEEKSGPNEVAITYHPAFYNTETKETTVFDEMGGVGSTVTDEGIGVVAEPATGGGYVVDVNAKATISGCGEWVKKNFGISGVPGYIRYFCTGGKTIYGMQPIAGGAGTDYGTYYVTVPKVQE